MNIHNLPLAAVKIRRFEQQSVRYKSILFGAKVLTNSYGLLYQNHQLVKGGKKNGTRNTQMHKVTHYVLWQPYTVITDCQHRKALTIKSIHK